MRRCGLRRSRASTYSPLLRYQCAAGEVADSLEARAGSQGGFGLLLWLRHVLEAEIATRGMPRYFFGYDQLLADWGNVVDGLERVTSVTLPGRSALTEAVVTDFLSESLRHQRRHCGHALEASMPEWVRSAYAIMRRWCEEGEQAEDFPALDAIRASFNAAAPSFAAAIARGVDRGDAPLFHRRNSSRLVPSSKQRLQRAMRCPNS